MMQLLFGPSPLERVFLEGNYNILLDCVVIEIEPGCFRDGVLNFFKFGRVNQMFHLIVVWSRPGKQKI